MKYAYFLDVQGPEDERNNSKVFQLITDFDIPEERVFVDENADDRTEFKTLLNLLKSGDTLIIRSAKDIADDVKDLYDEIFPELEDKYVELFSCEEPYLCGDTPFSTLNGFMLFLSYFYTKRKKTGYQKAVEEGRVGRPAKTESVEKAIRLYESKLYTIAQIETLTGVSKSTLYKYLKETGV